MTLYSLHTTIEPVSTPFTGLPFAREIPGMAGWIRIHSRMILALALALVVGAGLLWISTSITVSGEAAPDAEITVDTVRAVVPQVGNVALAPIFTPEVQRWGSKLVSWAGEFGLDPDVAAVIMQIESCGDPGAVSIAGAQGLFQVMPFHFVAGEDAFDPDTNARRGLGYFAERLAQTGGDMGKAFAGYNGGHVAAGGEWEFWPQETKDYFVWATGLYQDAKSQFPISPTLNAWLQAGGASLCRQAAGRIDLPAFESG